MDFYKNLKILSLYFYDVIIVGGGVIGVCIVWDVVMWGFWVMFFEVRDFCYVMSVGLLKFIYGGFWYFENYEFGLVCEVFRECCIWEIIVFYLVYFLFFCFFIYGDSVFEKYKFWVGLSFYDVFLLDWILLNDLVKWLLGYKYFFFEWMCVFFL